MDDRLQRPLCVTNNILNLQSKKYKHRLLPHILPTLGVSFEISRVFLLAGISSE